MDGAGFGSFYFDRCYSQSVHLLSLGNGKVFTHTADSSTVEVQLVYSLELLSADSEQAAEGELEETVLI